MWGWPGQLMAARRGADGGGARKVGEGDVASGRKDEPTILQCLWSFSLAIVDIYALLVKRCLRNRRAVCLFAIGDGITAALIFGAACSSAGITVLIDNDLNICAENHCGSFETATAMAFMSWFALTPC
ncbi:hypothetical protein TRIUR3_19883 [Triticum urartu]|uniref:CASP-like protein n=1 Tax=Triticum urartu TaxID=4572 RepID=M8A9X4_TRIUA|nr:hypothetical protein TRIUR3_19883 [Triticum urartu]